VLEEVNGPVWVAVGIAVPDKFFDVVVEVPIGSHLID